MGYRVRALTRQGLRKAGVRAPASSDNRCSGSARISAGPGGVLRRSPARADPPSSPWEEGEGGYGFRAGSGASSRPLPAGSGSPSSSESVRQFTAASPRKWLLKNP